MPLLSRVPPPVWPLVDGGLTSWGPLISGRRSLRGSEAGEQACAAAWMAWGHCLPSEGAMPSHTRSCSDGAMGTLPLSAGGSPAGPPPQTLREDVAGCACPSGGRQQGPVVGRAVRLAHLLKRRGTCTVGPRRRWVLLVPASHFTLTYSFSYLESVCCSIEILFIGQVYNCHIALQSFTLSSPGPTYALGTTSLPQRILRLKKIFKYIICLRFHLLINTVIKYHF